MRERHFPRLCRSCKAPMARQEASCWHCGSQWLTEAAPRTTLHVIPGGADAEARASAERWADEGGSVADAPAIAAVAAVAAIGPVKR